MAHDFESREKVHQIEIDLDFAENKKDSNITTMLSMC